MYKYICLDSPATTFQSIQGVFKTLEEATVFSKKTNTLVFEQIKLVDYSTWEFMYDEESEIDISYLKRMGCSDEDIEGMKKAYYPCFYIQDRTRLDDDRGCELPGWNNSMEYCYEVPSGWTKERAEQYLLSLGMKEREFTCGQ